MSEEARPKSLPRITLEVICLLAIFAILGGIFLGSTASNIRMAQKSAMMQSSRSLGLLLGQYAQDHQGRYLEGKTSTEVFQRLIDEKYVEDPAIFYLKLPGKVRAQSTQLKSENVGWDMTCCVDSTAPDSLPVVFLTGYKVVYTAGSSAVPVEKAPKTWSQWWNGPDFWKTFIAVCYKDNSARVLLIDTDGSIPNLIPADFDPKGKIYRQLTP